MWFRGPVTGVEVQKTEVGVSEVLGRRAGTQPEWASLASSITATGFVILGTFSGLLLAQPSLQTSSPLYQHQTTTFQGDSPPFPTRSSTEVF